ncbi:siderophore ABC transporter substrate-binding protein [Halalkalibacter sp. APA_J-10(15)]|uniref:siderophore ABC transporter substrate-binding protein n=1 Tax=Halalkalibacter sp. APA_J-10(15) TaxID=2933805 RepID=UPI001FF2DFE1|nr:siderophore ABC transporter substrate-binding protein [Halalkalibacter sp. APA_J-10(15)]MCK0470367.1 siderophore ABC transporter substrate-binding protein [Halalkalibacter sp. APA_J-10(15)]
MKKSLLLLFVSVLLALFMVACGGSEDTSSEPEENTEETAQQESNDEQGEEAADELTEITIDHELGQTVIEETPETVVVFDLGVLDTLDALGVEVAGVPVDSVPDYLSQYAEEGYENVGSLFEPDFEKIFDMQPDLIIISGRAAEAYEELEDIAPTLFMSTDPDNYLESLASNVTLLGDIFGKEELAAEKIADVETSVVDLVEKTSNVNGLIVLANDGSLSAFGPGSRFGFLHGEFGIEPTDENIEVSNHGQSISFEYIVETDPEYLFVVDRGAIVSGESSAQQIVENDVTENTTAYQEDKIIYLDPVFWYITTGGITATEGMIAEVDAAIQ